MRRKFEDYASSGHVNRPPEEVQAYLLFDIGRHLEEIATELERIRRHQEGVDDAGEGVEP